MSWLKTKSPTFGATIDGTALVVLKDDHWVDQMMQGMRLDANDSRSRSLNGIVKRCDAKRLREQMQRCWAELSLDSVVNLLHYVLL